MANCIKIARRKLCQSMIAKSRIIRKKGRIIIPKPSKMKPEPTQNDSKIDAETGLLKKSEKVTFRIPLGFLPVYSFWSKIRPKSSKLRFVQDFWHPKRHPKIDAEKVWKSMPEGSQNGTKMEAKTINCSYIFKKGENC